MGNNWYKEAVVEETLSMIDACLEADNVTELANAQELVVDCYKWLDEQDFTTPPPPAGLAAIKPRIRLHDEGFYAIKEHCDPRLADTWQEKRRRIITCYLGLSGHLQRGELL